MFQVDYKVIDYGSPEYLQSVDLRNEILRKPLGLSIKGEDLAAEKGDTFFAGLKDSLVVACLAITSYAPGVVRMRAVAVAEEFQKLGLGSGLVRYSEEIARGGGATRMVLHARETAVPFYRRQGYEASGEPFIEVGILHRFMSKELAFEPSNYDRFDTER